MCQAPAVMAVNCPSGGFDCPWWSDPQQWAVLSSRSPQVCWVPAAMAVYRPSGAVDWPLLLSPQHWAVPVGRIPQVW